MARPVRTMHQPLDEDAADDGPATAIHCDVCLIGSHREPVKVFYLMAPARRPNGAPTTRGAGRLYLCESCWKRGPGKRRRPRERHVRQASA